MQELSLAAVAHDPPFYPAPWPRQNVPTPDSLNCIAIITVSRSKSASGRGYGYLHGRQCLPAAKQYELENSQEFLEMEQELNAPESKVDSEVADYREALLKGDDSRGTKRSAQRKSSKLSSTTVHHDITGPYLAGPGSHYP